MESRNSTKMEKSEEAASPDKAVDAGSSGKAGEAEEFEIPDTHRCGYGRCKPDCMQGACNSPGMLLTAECLFLFIQTFVTSGIVSVNMSTLERRYELSSSEVAWIPVSYDLVAGVAAVFYGYLGVFVHNGLLLTSCAYFMALGSFIMTLPHWLGGTYQAGIETTKFCDVYGNTTVCEDGESNYLGFFILAQAFHGIGGGGLWVIVFPYLDSNVRQKYTAFFIGIAFIATMLGAAFGYVCGGLLLTIYVDVGRVDMDEVTVELGDPRWVGAWWIGYFISCAVFLITAIFMCAFPRELPSALKYKHERVSEAYKGTGLNKTAAENFGKSWKDIRYSLKIIFTNPIWVGNTIVAIFVSGLLVAFGIFLPKLMETQFSLTPSAAAAIAGAVILPGTVVGLLIGGWIPRHYKLTARGLMGQCMTVSILCMILAFIYLIHCQSPAMAGVTVPYYASDSSVELEGDPDVQHACNAHCNCTTDAYDPLCGYYDNVEYFSPCIAGCLTSTETDDDEYYHYCSCVNTTHAPPQTPPDSTAAPRTDAYRGMCDTDCSDELSLFIILFMVQTCVTCVALPSGQTLGLRCLPDKERAFAFGIGAILIRYLGNVPAPLILGAIFDSSCLLWQESCGETGSCWMYENWSLAWGFVWCIFIVSGICVLCYIFELIVYKPPPPEVTEICYVKTEDELTEEEKTALEERAAMSARGSIVSASINGDIGTDWQPTTDDLAELTKL